MKRDGQTDTRSDGHDTARRFHAYASRGKTSDFDKIWHATAHLAYSITIIDQI